MMDWIKKIQACGNVMAGDSTGAVKWRSHAAVWLTVVVALALVVCIFLRETGKL
jgi:hypothetical protein